MTGSATAVGAPPALFGGDDGRAVVVPDALTVDRVGEGEVAPAEVLMAGVVAEADPPIEPEEQPAISTTARPSPHPPTPGRRWRAGEHHRRIVVPKLSPSAAGRQGLAAPGSIDRTQMTEGLSSGAWLSLTKDTPRLCPRQATGGGRCQVLAHGDRAPSRGVREARQMPASHTVGSRTRPDLGALARGQSGRPGRVERTEGHRLGPRRRLPRSLAATKINRRRRFEGDGTSRVPED